MSVRGWEAEGAMARGTILVALSVWLVCAAWIGSRWQVVPSMSGGAGGVPLGLVARMALVLFSVVLVSLCGWSLAGSGRVED
ncbi:hypothetical protein [Neotabrizicola shimadae]|uniref:Uncharacterized protein n=1 Tax=Neotabrizicola shimadae TaxID=2807096 RepID=A0A8G0ZXF1_9RHOB|nr:hypothetical protein [Neotabrizicola shimadae]QYZ69819.1 hypothetical protein JO391_19330 [Neotabrizicola shimadae]